MIYEINALIPPRVNVSEDVDIDPDDLPSVIQRIARKHHWIIVVVKAKHSKFEYYRYDGNKVFYYPPMKRWITVDEYEQLKN